MIVRDGGRGDDSGREGWRGVGDDGGSKGWGGVVMTAAVRDRGWGDDSEGWREG